jgi:hypothetical protein
MLGHLKQLKVECCQQTPEPQQLTIAFGDDLIEPLQLDQANATWISIVL